MQEIRKEKFIKLWNTAQTAFTQEKLYSKMDQLTKRYYYLWAMRLVTVDKPFASPFAVYKNLLPSSDRNIVVGVAEVEAAPRA